MTLDLPILILEEWEALGYWQGVCRLPNGDSERFSFKLPLTSSKMQMLEGLALQERLDALKVKL